MKAIICLPLDFRANSLGLKSLLAEEIDGAPVLRHAVSRLTLSDDYTVVLLATGPDAEKELATAREMLSGLAYETHASAAPDVPNREFLRRGRLWSISSWRGGIGATSYYDEAGSPAAMLDAARRFGADAVGLMTPDSPYADPSLAAKLFAWHYDHAKNARVTVTGVPPGLVPAIVNIEVLEAFAKNNLTFAATMVYNPAQPQRDLAATEAHYEAPLELRLAPWRLTAHSRRQLEMMRSLASFGVSPRSASSLEVVRALSAHSELWSGALPAKVEMEPTMRLDAAPEYLRQITSSRGASDMDLGAFCRVVEPLGVCGDVVLSLQGLGEPLLHAALPQMVSAAKGSGLFGVHVGTYGRTLDEAYFADLVASRLDVLSVNLSAHTPERYKAIFGVDGLDAVRSAVEAAVVSRRASKSAWPIIATEIVKMREVEPDIEPFFDYWHAHSDWPVIRPYTDFAGQIDDRATIQMRTSSRIPCRKIFQELYIDAEAVAYPCRQDIRRRHPLGNAAEEGIAALWHSDYMERLRAAHIAGDYDFFPLCRNCKDWYYV